MRSDVDGLERVSITSMGIDIGTSTSHVVFSRLVAQRRGADLSAQFEVTGRYLIWAAPVIFTPYLDEATIDTAALTRYLERGCRDAGLGPADIDTGMVVVTGAALDKDNAQAIAEHFASTTGRFVCVSAGPHHEAILAAYGSGAVALSRRDASAVMNLDIGGGTTKIAVLRAGAVVQTASLTVGARLIAFDGSDRLVRIEPAGRVLAELVGFRPILGEPLPAWARESLVDLMASLILAATAGQPPDERLTRVLLTAPVSADNAVSGMAALVISGGVAEYLTDPASTGHGDLGLDLARRLEQRLDEQSLSGRLRQAVQAARATVLGAGEHSLTPSGITGYISDPTVLPVFGLQAVKLTVTPGCDLLEVLHGALARLDHTAYGPAMAFALTFPQPPQYSELLRTARAIAAAVAGSDSPVFIVMDADRGHSLGAILHRELRCPNAIVSVDGVRVGELDFLDIGVPVGNSASVPVTVKSLIFSTEEHPTVAMRS